MGDAGDVGAIPGLGRSPEEGNGNTLQYFCLRNPMDRGAWRATVHGVAKSWTWLSTHACTCKSIHSNYNFDHHSFGCIQFTILVDVHVDSLILYLAKIICSTHLCLSSGALLFVHLNSQGPTCASLSNSVFSSFMLTAWNWQWWEYFMPWKSTNAVYQGSLFSREQVVVPLSEYHCI